MIHEVVVHQTRRLRLQEISLVPSFVSFASSSTGPDNFEASIGVSLPLQDGNLGVQPRTAQLPGCDP